MKGSKKSFQRRCGSQRKYAQGGSKKGAGRAVEIVKLQKEWLGFTRGLILFGLSWLLNKDRSSELTFCFPGQQAIHSGQDHKSWAGLPAGQTKGNRKLFIVIC